MRRCVAWLVAVPLLLAGSQSAHVLAYRWVYPDAHVRLRELVASGHDYMSLLPFVLGAAAAILTLSLALTVVDAFSGRPQRKLPAWAFALLPMVGFTAQEHLERLLESGSFPWHAVGDPTFLPGLALQVPFGLAAYLAARILLRAAERSGRLLALAAPRVRRLTWPALSAPPAFLDLPRVAVAMRSLGKRGPPLLSPV